jgi:hypothetical protein
MRPIITCWCSRRTGDAFEGMLQLPQVQSSNQRPLHATAKVCVLCSGHLAIASCILSQSLVSSWYWREAG